MDKVLETYDVLSRGLYTHATPITCNGGTVRPNFASCYIFQPDVSNPHNLLHSATDLDLLWRSGGGVGMSFSEVPARRCVFYIVPPSISLMKIHDQIRRYIVTGSYAIATRL